MNGNINHKALGWGRVLTALLLVLGGFTPTCVFGSSPTGGKNPIPQEPLLIIIGASYAKDWAIRSAGAYHVVNKGMGGEETHQLLARFNQDVIKQRPSAVLIWGFINDIFRSSREELPDKLKRTRENLQAMIVAASAAGIRPILATEVLITSPDRVSDTLLAWVGKVRGKQSYQSYVNAHVRDVNSWIRETGATRKITVLDFERTLADEHGERQRRYATEDGSHLSTEAYAALTKLANHTLGRK